MKRKKEEERGEYDNITSDATASTTSATAPTTFSLFPETAGKGTGKPSSSSSSSTSNKPSSISKAIVKKTKRPSDPSDSLTFNPKASFNPSTDKAGYFKREKRRKYADDPVAAFMGDSWVKSSQAPGEDVDMRETFQMTDDEIREKLREEKERKKIEKMEKKTEKKEVSEGIDGNDWFIPHLLPNPAPAKEGDEEDIQAGGEED